VVNRWFVAGAVVAASSLALLLVVACEPSLDETTYAVTSPRVLAVRSVSQVVVLDGGSEAGIAEAVPGGAANAGGEVTLSALYVGPDGGIDAGLFDWAFCIARNPLANLGPVSPLCAQRSGPSTVFQEVGTSSSVTAVVPTNACNNFGPDVPMVVVTPDAGDGGGQSPGRPVDPDSTGGYYQPVRLAAGDQIAQAFVRVNCGNPPGATPAQLGALSTFETVANTNPAIKSTMIILPDGSDGGMLNPEETGKRNPVVVSQPVTFSANWDGCPPDASICTGSQTYALLDPLTFEVVYPQEQMRVSWFSTAGTFTNDTTAPDGAAAVGPSMSADNSWTPPATPTPPQQPAHMWVVLRDNRGGVGWQSYVFDVNVMKPDGG
jgi:hypothetical protein